MKLLLRIFSSLLIILVFELHAETGLRQVPIAPDGETMIEADSVTQKVRVTIQTHQVNIGKPSDQRPTLIRSNCTYSRYPCSLVDVIDITIGGKLIFVPRSVFSDLADLSSAKIQAEKKDWLLTLRGGDASESYIVQIKFDRERVKHRNLSSAMSPNKSLQETVYHEVGMGD